MVCTEHKACAHHLAGRSGAPAYRARKGNVDVLVLSRSVGETIRIGPDIYVTVVKVTPYSIRLGIEAPQQTSIMRGELLDDPPEVSLPQLVEFREGPGPTDA